MSNETALHPVHAELGAKFTDFGGWDMPLKYGRELEEHRAVREAVGLFDLSHMGEVRVTGPDAAAFLDHALISRISAVKVGKAKYSMICREDGGIIDDLITYVLAPEEYLVIPNAGNAPAVFAALTGLGYVGLWLAPSTVPLLWAVLLGIGGCCFPTAIALIPARSRTPLVTARLSGFVQPLGYFIAGLGPFVLGVVHEQVGAWDGILIVLVGTAVLMGVLGVLAGKRTVIDDELMATHWRELAGH